MNAASDPVPIKDAATIVLVRKVGGETQMLMGQRGSKAVFMPDKFVFPGGAVDAGDAALDHPVPEGSEAQRLSYDSATTSLCALQLAAVRELWEETGLVLGRFAAIGGAAVPDNWRDFHAAGYVPDTSSLQFFFRAITPQGRPRRFDARFFIAPAEGIVGDLDDFSNASDELSNLCWISIEESRSLPLPFITEIVIAEVAAWIAHEGARRPVPFFDNRTDEPMFRSIA
jgi:8-oxo-dGTP pyrophosphatase MutT (NUDIX family)